jgi:hypothetical protein
MVTVSPTSASLFANEAGNSWPANLTQKQFTASVQNTSNTTVTWSVSSGGGSIDATSGLYTAPATVPAGPVTVTATSQADTSKSNSATVNINTPTEVKTFNVTVTATVSGKNQSKPVTLTVN